MAKPKQNKGRKAPISSHPAFPAVVALWFAALLGLGSLVIPVVVLEKITTATGLASVFSAAAPPLGVKARLLIALVWALAGAGIGYLLARKVLGAQRDAAPKQRKRAQYSQSDNLDDGPSAKRPISARDELGSDSLDEPVEDDTVSRAPPIPGRRRALAVTDESGPSDFYESAPLPGGAMAFDGPVGDDDGEDAVDFQSDFEAPAAPAAAFDDGPFAHRAVKPEEPAPFARPGEQESEAAPAFAQAPDTGPLPDFSGSDVEDYRAPDFGPRPGEEPAAPTPVAQAPQAPFAQPQARLHPLADSAPLDASDDDTLVPDEQNFDDNPADRLRKELSDMSDHNAPHDAAYNPFAARAGDAQDVQAPFAAPEAPAPTPFAAPAAEVPAPFAPAATAAPAAAPAGEYAAQPAIQPEIAQRPLHEMGMVELVERFAMALQPGASAAPVEAAPAEAAPVRQPAPEPAPFENPAPQSFAAPETFSAPAPEPAQEPAPHAAPAPFAAPDVQQSAPAQPAASENAPAGMVFRRQSAPVAAEPVNPEPVTPAPAVPQAYETDASFPTPSVPSALRPVGMDEEDDEEDSFDGLTLDLSQRFEPEDDIADESDEDDAQEDAYSSLLAMKSPSGSSQQFPRIDDSAEMEDAGTEPVVVFPGQDQRRAAPASDGPVRDPMPQEAPFGASAASGAASAPRPFDAPNRPSAPAGNGVNAGETERALREALEKLQRMSGAA